MPFTLTMPKLSPTMEAGVIAKWHKKPGDRIEAGDLLLEVSTDKATVEHSALDEGYMRKILVPEGGEAKVNDPIAIFTETLEESIEGFEPKAVGGEAIREKAQPLPIQEKPAERAVETGRPVASPLARKLAKLRGIDLSKVRGSGPRGRIVAKDLDEGIARTSAEEAMTPVRKVIAQRLQQAKSSIPHFYVTMQIDAMNLVDFREHLSRMDIKVSVNDCIVKACALALKEHPVVNSGYNSANDTLIRFSSIDISVAVSIEAGLITPIVPAADTKPLSQISEEIRALAKKAKEGKLAPAEFQGGSFTVSNLGMYGVSDFAAIINPPQAAILAVGAILDQPVVKQGAVVAGKVMHLTLSADHRVVDGVAAAEFLRSVKKFLEQPIALLI